VAANCNFVSLAWDWVTKTRLGLTVGDLSLQPFIDQFNIASGCKQVIPCEPPATEDCDRDFVFLCNFIIGLINYTYDPQGKVQISAPINLYRGGKAPYTATWTWDAQVFSYVAGQGTATVTLQRLPGVPDNTSTTVFVHAFDTDGCKDDGQITFGFPIAITECPNATLTPNKFFLGVPYTGTLLIPYGGGNGEPYAGLTIQSTGVDGLTATLPPGVLATGDGNLVFNISGVPGGVGLGAFTFKLFSDTPCTVNFSSADTVCATPYVTHTVTTFDINSGYYTIQVAWSTAGTNVDSYTLTYTVGVNPPVTVVFPHPTNGTTFLCPPETQFSYSLTANCFHDSDPATGSGQTSTAPIDCPAPTNVTATITGYNPANQLYTIRVQWDIMTGAVRYAATDKLVPLGQGGNTVTNYFDFFKPENTPFTFGVTTQCNQQSGFSPESTVSGATPLTITLDPLDQPVVHMMANYKIPASNKSTLTFWHTYDSDTYRVIVQQGIPFDIFYPDDPPFTPEWSSDSGELIPGQDNGMTAISVPGGLGPHDIAFLAGPPRGYNMIGNQLNFVRITTIRSGTPTPAPTVFEYWMNVPKAYVTRSGTEDYISTDVTIPRPVISISNILPASLGGSFDVTVVVSAPPFNYDTCSAVRMFLVPRFGGITTYPLTKGAGGLFRTISGLNAGIYMVFVELNYDACTASPVPWATAIPVLVEIKFN
jgi:hypothetical protein